MSAAAVFRGMRQYVIKCGSKKDVHCLPRPAQHRCSLKHDGEKVKYARTKRASVALIR